MRVFAQMAFAGTGLLALTALVISLLLSDLYNESYHTDIRRQSKTLHQVLAEALADRVVRGEALEVRSILEEIVSDSAGFAYLYVTDFDGALFAHTFAQGFPRALLSTLGPGLAHIAESRYATEIGRTNLYSAPLIEGMQARIFIGTDDGHLQQISARQNQRVISITIAVMIGGLFLWLVVARRISAPLSHLTRLIVRYGGGVALNPGEIPKDGAVEVRELAQAMAGMVEKRNALASSLEASEGYLRTLFESSPIGLALTRMDGTFVDANTAYAATIGRSVDEVMELSYWELTPAELREQEQEQLRSLTRTGRFGPCEKEYLHKDGHWVPVRLLGRLVERDGERFIWSAVEDISAFREMQALDVRLSNILEHSYEEIYISDGQTMKFLQVSSGALANLGYAMDEMRRMTTVDLTSDFTEESFTEFVEPLRSGERPQLIFEARHQRKNGSQYPVEVRLQFANEGKKSTFFAIVVDLTERKRIEAELERHREHLEALVDTRTETVRHQAQIIDQTHDSIATTDLDGQVISWNGGAEQLFGFSAEEAIGKHFSFVFPDGRVGFVVDEVVATLKDHGRRDTEVQMQRADSTVFPAHLSLSLLNDEHEIPIGIIAYSMDLTELKRREAELGLMTSRLQVSNRELESFAYSVSHDLRAPLRAIDGFSLALIEDYTDKLDSTGRDYLNRVRGAAQRMGDLIDGMLELSRVTRSELMKTTVDLGDVARAVVDELRAGDPARQVEFNIGDGMVVQGDGRMLRILLDNLLGNAWKFSAREALPKITIARLPGDAPIFYVNDNGVGFDLRYAEKLFGAFQRLHHVDDFSGTGIGLATARRIVHRHGGRIWADAIEGEGATFYFVLGSSPELGPAGSGGTGED
ncbi:MAG: PAS domain S-box protein [Gammaproteobacteria bacterium]|nr:PAS domain S-box protein [Gammaproteobacteria bacterium]